MDDLRRELAPVSAPAWRAIDAELARVLEAQRTARALVDVAGPFGPAHGSASRGRTRPLGAAPAEGVEGRLREVRPLVELRVPFELVRSELDAVSSGARDPDLAPLARAAEALARAEDGAVFGGLGGAGIRGVCADSPHAPVTLDADYTRYPDAVTRALEALQEEGVAGPFAIALGPRCWAGLRRTVTAGGFPVLEHVRRLLEGPAVWAPAVDGAAVLSLRGGDFRLELGRDACLAYEGHDRERVRLELRESFTFELLGPEAAVPLVYAR